jgi:hypothetical protein
MADEDSSTIGARGLVVYDGKTYSYITEGDWRTLGYVSDAPAEFQDLVRLNAVVAQLGEAILVDLDRLGELEPPSVELEPRPSKAPWQAVRSVVLRENAVFYQITEDKLRRLDEGFEGDAGVLVTRGAVVASIPSNSIPSGTYCVLVNRTSLTRP